MSLLDRTGGGAGGSLEGRYRDFKRQARDALYERISPERVSRLSQDNPALARKELQAHLEQLLQEARWLQAPTTVRDQVKVELLNDILGLGPIEPLLADTTVTEVMVNGPDMVFFERGGIIHQSAVTFDDSEHVMTVIDRIVAPLGRRVDEKSPMVNARLPEGHRVNAIIPPLALNGPTLTVRKFRTKIFDLRELVRMGSLEEWMAVALEWAVVSRRNIAVTGGTGSGKTTLLNALSIAIPTKDRIITVEDSAELRFQRHPHVVSLEGRPPNLEGEGEVSIRDLVINCLRMRPDRIVVGEVRGGEALDMLQAMNTGHDGSLTTLHANSPREAVQRLVTMVRYVAELPVDTIREQIASAIHIFVHEDRLSDGTRRVTRIVESEGMSQGEVALRDVVVWEQTGIDAQGRVLGRYILSSRPTWIDALVTQGVATQEEVAAWDRSLPS